MSKELPIGWFWDGGLLKSWRVSSDRTAKHMAEVIGISEPHYYRIENGMIPPMFTANRIVNVTCGAVRYRDIYPNFEVKYA